jgi:hypothetical protein
MRRRRPEAAPATAEEGAGERTWRRMEKKGVR